VRRHELDWVSLLAGALFVAVAVVYVFAEAADVELDPQWVLPTVLVGLGLVGLAGSLRGAGRSHPIEPEAGGSAAADAQPTTLPDEETTVRVDDGTTVRLDDETTVRVDDESTVRLDEGD
jgi:ferric-dicitrate binding protein FerR (iron transport regulator)